MTDTAEMSKEEIVAQNAEAKAKAAEAKAIEKAEKAKAAKIEKEAKAATKAKEAAEKKAAKETEKLNKANEREAAKAAKIKAKEDAKSAKEAEREANKMPEQNGIRRPKPNTLCGKVWALCDSLSSELKQPVPIKSLLEASAKEELNEGNVKAEYARWRKFNGVTGRVSLPKEEKETKEEA